MPRPNILWICTDQQRWDTLGCYGNAFVRTPNLDRLAAEGVLFDHAYCQNPVCMPSRGSFLTGRYPRRTGLQRNGGSLPEHERILPRILADAGYHCGLAGKLHIHPHASDQPEPRGDDGYAEFYWSPNPWPEFPTDQYRAWLREQGLTFERKPFQGSPYVECPVDGEHSHTHWCCRKTIEFVESRASSGGAWLFSLNLFDPHLTFDPPEEYLRPYLSRLDDIPLPNYTPEELVTKPAWHRQWFATGKNTYYGHYPCPEMTDRDHRLCRAAYWAMCDQIDREVGRVLEALDRTGQRGRTVVIFTSDHGEMLGDHGVYLKGPFMYDPAVRVPLIVAMPGAVAGGRRARALVELVDLAPTLLEAAGLDVPGNMQGRSLWPLLTDPAAPDAHREDVYCESYNASGRPKGVAPVYATMLRTPTHKLIVQHATDEGELYDVAADPRERHNLWDDPASRALRFALLRRMCDRVARM